MGSKKEEERNEKIIRGLLKLPPNRRCINCDSLGPQYVCTNFWTFVCISCSGIHREFTHRVKSVSMAKFTAQEVDELQRGGNQRAREIFLILKDWDTQRSRLPDNSNVDKIREFISVYVDKKYAVERSSDKPHRDTQSPKDPEDYRRASSYHSFSQSPPYDHQYEDRRYGKQTGMLTRKPGSYRGHSEGKISSFMFSPGRQVEQIYEDRFANEGSGSRISDYSLSSRSDPFKSDGQSPNFQDAGYVNPPSQQLRDILIEDAQPQILKTFPEANVKKDFDGIPCSQRAASSSSFGSPDENSATNLGSLLDIGLEPEHPSGTQQGRKSALFSSQISASAHSKNLDLFSLPEVQQSTTSIAPSVDLFEGINHQAPFTDLLQQKELADPISENVGWATFDLPHHSESSSKTINGLTSMVPSDVAAHTSATSTMYNNSEWFSVQNSATHGHFPSTNNSLHVDFVSDDTKNSQPWNAFDDFTGNVSRTSVGALPQNHEAKVEVHKLTSGESYINFEVPEAPIDCGFQKSADVATLGFNLPFTGVTGSSFSASVLPMTEGTTREPTNPFDLPFDADQEDNNVFPDMSSLQEGLENPQFPFPTSFFGDLSQPWFPQNPITTFIPSLPQGELIYTAEQVPSSQLQNVPPQNSVASLGNPFA